jgi:tetratricopeptide (TPR) repeat protein
LTIQIGNAIQKPSIKTKTNIARVLVNKGATLGQLGRREEAIALCDEVLNRFDTATEPELRVCVAQALINKGAMLGKLNRPEEAITVYDDVLIRFGVATESALRESVAKALINKGLRLVNLIGMKKSSPCATR